MRQTQIDGDPARFVQDHPDVVAAREARKRTSGLDADKQYYAAVKAVEDHLGVDPGKQRLLSNVEIKGHLQAMKGMSPSKRAQYIRDLQSEIGIDLLPSDLRLLSQAR